MNTSPSTYSTELYSQVLDVMADAICPETGVLDLTVHEPRIINLRNNLILKQEIKNEDFIAMMGTAVRHLWDVRMDLHLGPEAASA